MKDKIKNYVDGLFEDIPDNQQLRELKEEISANLLEKVNDFAAKGNSEEIALNKAVSSLGDMSELVDSLRKASRENGNPDKYRTFPLDKKQVIGYVTASAVFLFGIMVGAIVYLRQRDLVLALTYLTPFILIAAPIFSYFGLIQETGHHYGMNHRRAISYSLAGEVLLLGIIAAGVMFFQRQEPLMIFASFMPFAAISTIAFLYLGLTEKKRRKMGPGWEKQWIEYYSNPQTWAVKGAISGALWIFSIAVFFLISFTWGWKYSWIVFVVAVGLEVLMDAFFAAKKKN
jgi:hypothetical protein